MLVCPVHKSASLFFKVPKSYLARHPAFIRLSNKQSGSISWTLMVLQIFSQQTTLWGKYLLADPIPFWYWQLNLPCYSSKMLVCCFFFQWTTRKRSAVHPHTTVSDPQFLSLFFLAFFTVSGGSDTFYGLVMHNTIWKKKLHTWLWLEKFWVQKYSLGFLQPELTLFLDNLLTNCSIWSQMQMAPEKVDSDIELDCIWLYLTAVYIITSSKKLVLLSSKQKQSL